MRTYGSAIAVCDHFLSNWGYHGVPLPLVSDASGGRVWGDPWPLSEIKKAQACIDSSSADIDYHLPKAYVAIRFKETGPFAPDLPAQKDWYPCYMISSSSTWVESFCHGHNWALLRQHVSRRRGRGNWAESVFMSGISMCLPRACGDSRGKNSALRELLVLNMMKRSVPDSGTIPFPPLDLDDLEMLEIVPPVQPDFNPHPSELDAAAANWWSHVAADMFAHRYPAANLSHRELELASVVHNVFGKDPGALHGRRVLDYGIGAGAFAKVALRAGASFYAGIDISERSLLATRRTLNRHFPSFLKDGKAQLRMAPVNFANFNPDLIVSFSVVWHLGSLKELQQFLFNLDNSGSQELLFDFRHADVTYVDEGDWVMNSNGKLHFVGGGDGIYKDLEHGPTGERKSKTMVCSVAFVCAHLPHYQLVWQQVSLASRGNPHRLHTLWRRRSFRNHTICFAPTL